MRKPLFAVPKDDVVRSPTKKTDDEVQGGGDSRNPQEPSRGVLELKFNPRPSFKHGDAPL